MDHTVHAPLYLALSLTVMSKNPLVGLKKTVVPRACCSLALHSVWPVLWLFILLPIATGQVLVVNY